MSNAQFETFRELVKSKVTRQGVDELLDWLGASDFPIAPASTRFHGAHEGGLVQHCLNVYNRLVQINESFGFDFDGTSMAVVALFHDLCKVDFYKREKKSRKTGEILPNGKPVWEDYWGYVRDERFHFGGHGSKSLFLVMNFMHLTCEEASAINCHMGPWDRQDYGNPGEVFESNPLAWALHVADEAATYLDET